MKFTISDFRVFIFFLRLKLIVLNDFQRFEFEQTQRQFYHRIVGSGATEGSQSQQELSDADTRSIVPFESYTVDSVSNMKL